MDMKKCNKLIGILILIIVMAGCAGNNTNNSNYEYSINDADVFIEVPNLRQYGDYSCGTTCVQMIMNYLYPYDYDINLTQYEVDLKTDKQEGTSSENIIAFFDGNEVSYQEKEELSIDELISYLKERKIIMMPIQAWSTSEDGSFNIDDPDKEDYLIEGHWVICVGYKQTQETTIFYFNDPACVGYCVMNKEDLDRRWIDMDSKGKLYKHYGLVIEGNDNYSNDGAYYLN